MAEQPNRQAHATAMTLGIVIAVLGGFGAAELTGAVDWLQHGRDPLTVAVDEEFDDDGTLCHSFVTRRPLKDVPHIGDNQSNDSVLAWRDEQDAVDAGYTEVVLTIQSQNDDTLVLQGLDVEVDSRSKPMAGKTVFLGPGCGGATQPRYFTVNLDHAHPRAVPESGMRGGVNLEDKLDFPYTVSNSDVEVFHVFASVERHYVTWHLVLRYTSDGEAHAQTVDYDGQSFATTRDVMYPYVWARGGWAWSRLPGV